MTSLLTLLPRLSAPGRRTPSAGWYWRRWRRGAPGRGGRGRRMSQTGRAVLLWTLALYAVVQFGLVAAMSRWHPTFCLSITDHKWRRLRRVVASEPDRPLLLMLGSSRTEQGFEAGRLEGLTDPDGRAFVAYNFGLPACGPMNEWLYLREILDAGIRPRLLLVEFVTPLFNEPHKKIVSEELWTPGAWLSLPELIRLWPYLTQRRRKTGEWLEARVAPWYAVRPQLQNTLLQQMRSDEADRVDFPHDAWGWQVPEPMAREELEKRWHKANNQYRASLYRFRVGKGPRRAMRDLLQLCRREQIPVVMVLMPETRLFQIGYRPSGLREARRLVEDLRDAFGVDLIDATGWVHDGLFADGHHLRAEGARVFSDRLRGELKRILARYHKE